MTLCRGYSTINVFKIVVGYLLINAVLLQVNAGKKKKVIIKVPTHVKHVYHHHLKTIHIQPSTPKPQHHVHHDHFDHHDHHDVVEEHVHHDRDDFKGKRQGRGYGSWRGYDGDAESSKYRSYRSYMTALRPPPLTGGSEGQETFEGGWKPLGHRDGPGKWKGEPEGFRSNKGVVYEQITKGTESKGKYEDVDLTYQGLKPPRPPKSSYETYQNPQEDGYLPEETDTTFGLKVPPPPPYIKGGKRTSKPPGKWLLETSTQSGVSVWPEMKEHSSWHSIGDGSDLGNRNTAPQSFTHSITTNNPGSSSSSYVVRNFGGAQETVAKAITPSPIFSTGRPVSSYQVQVMHYNSDNTANGQ